MEQSFFTLLGFLLEDHNEPKGESISVAAHCYCKKANVKNYLNKGNMFILLQFHC